MRQSEFRDFFVFSASLVPTPPKPITRIGGGRWHYPRLVSLKNPPAGAGASSTGLSESTGAS